MAHSVSAAPAHLLRSMTMRWQTVFETPLQICCSKGVYDGTLYLKSTHLEYSLPSTMSVLLMLALAVLRANEVANNHKRTPSLQKASFYVPQAEYKGRR
jgi:L-lactate permease